MKSKIKSYREFMSNSLCNTRTKHQKHTNNINNNKKNGSAIAIQTNQQKKNELKSVKTISVTTDWRNFILKYLFI